MLKRQKTYGYHLFSQEKKKEKNSRFLKESRDKKRQKSPSAKKKEKKEEVNGIVLIFVTVLPKIYRLKKREVEEVFQKGRTYRGFFLILEIKKNNLPFSRWSFIVPVGLSRKAVKRNRLRRRLRENFRGKLKIIKPGFDGIILAFPPALEKKYSEIDKEIDKLLHLADICK